MHRNLYRALALSMACVVAASTAFAEAAPRLDLKSIDSFVASCASGYRIPGLSLAIVEDGKTVFAAGYGEAARGIPATADTPYIIGSTSKMFTALAVLRLVEEGKVDLDSPYKRYVPEFALARPGEAEKITVRHLLNMTSGLTDRGMGPLAEGEANPEAELARLRKGRLSVEPGTFFHYYTINYRLLALLVERVGGAPFAEFVGREVFAPIGMRSSRVDPAAVAGDSEAREALAQGHGVFLGFPIERRQEIRVSAFGSGMMVSTARNVGKYLESELAVRGGAPTIGAVSPMSLAASWSVPNGVGFSAAENLGDGVGYGMGWMVINAAGEVGRKYGGGDRGAVYLFHGGALENFQSAFFLDPQRRRGFAILMNQGGISAQMSVNVVRDGLIAFMSGKEPEPLKPRRPIVAIFALILFVSTAFSVFRLARLGVWRRKAIGRISGRGGPAARDWIGAAVPFAATIALVFGLMPLGNLIMGDYSDWTMIGGMAPDAVCALPVLLAGSVAVFAIKAWTLTRLASASHLTNDRP